MSVMLWLWENWYAESIAWFEFVTWSTLKTAFDFALSISHFQFDSVFFFFVFKNSRDENARAGTIMIVDERLWA